MNLLALIKTNSGADYHRLTLPLDATQLEKHDQIRRVFTGGKFNEIAFHGIDVVTFSRECPIPLGDLGELKRKYQFKIVVDVDDYWSLYPAHYLYAHWEASKVGIKMIAAIKIADAVITTHERLKAKILPLNENVIVVPNALPYGVGQFDSMQVKQGTKENILYCAGASHLQDLKTIGGALNLCKHDKGIQNKFRFLLAGYNSETEDSIQMWDRIERVASMFGDYDILPSLPLVEYMEHYRKASVCIAPLENNYFNQMKSNLKILEAGAKCCPIIVSAVHPYITDENPGVILCKTQKDWYRAIKGLSEDKIYELGLALHKYCLKNYNLLEVNKKRIELYRSL